MSASGSRLQGFDQVDNVPNTIASNRLLPRRSTIRCTRHHRGRHQWSGSLKSAVGLGTLLALRRRGNHSDLALPSTPRRRSSRRESSGSAQAARARPRADRSPPVGACSFDMDTVVARSRNACAPTTTRSRWPCSLAVNGIGEASHADFGSPRQERRSHLRPRQAAAKVPQDDHRRRAGSPRSTSRSTRGEIVTWTTASGRGAAWLNQIEEENAGELTPERIAAMEAAGPPRTR